MNLAERVLEVAIGQVGVRETARNRGPEVDQYIRCMGLDPGNGSYSWCACFVFWCFEQASKAMNIGNPMARSAGVLRLWGMTPADQRSATPQNSSIFVQSKGDGRGHCGIVAARGGKWLVTVEGNTDASGTRDGDGVYVRTRATAEVNLGFIVLT